MATVRSKIAAKSIQASGAKGFPLDPYVPLTAFAAAFVTAGFFLPWLQGAGIFSQRSFAGFDLAGVARDLGPDPMLLSLPGLPLVLYLVPAMVLNAALLVALAGSLSLTTLHQGVIGLAAGLYGLAVTGTLLFLSLSPVSGLGGLVSGPGGGLLLSVAGSLGFVLIGAKRLRSS